MSTVSDESFAKTNNIDNKLQLKKQYRLARGMSTICSFGKLLDWNPLTLSLYFAFVLHLCTCVTLFSCTRFTWKMRYLFSQSVFSNSDDIAIICLSQFSYRAMRLCQRLINFNFTDSFSLEEATRDSGSTSESRKSNFEYLTPLWIVMLAVAVPTTVFMIWRATKKCKWR